MVPGTLTKLTLTYLHINKGGTFLFPMMFFFYPIVNPPSAFLCASATSKITNFQYISSPISNAFSRWLFLSTSLLRNAFFFSICGRFTFRALVLQMPVLLQLSFSSISSHFHPILSFFLLLLSFPFLFHPFPSFCPFA